ncbi:MAG TPA: laccase domain-containing protein, partial [Acidimicrobiia bacterium]|nr:laccase domain-containing protein [Acidimicrobiia bacterium]
IRACCYEFGTDDLALVVDRFGPAVEGRTTGGRPALDVPAVVRAALAEEGIDTIVDLGICTACSPDCFSYRRDGTTGRQGLLVALRSPG